jgi:flagellar basal-body rod protein FlgG
MDINTAGGIFAAEGEGVVQLGNLRLVRFVNPTGLEAAGKGQYYPTANSGGLLPDRETKVWQGFLEASNVSLGDEMTSLIRAQRAYQANSQSVRTLDEMWGKTNSLRR